MITSIKINNFKSLVNFECKLDKFSCLIGLNGAGKSTILQALDFLSQLMEGNIEGWLDSRHWNKSDLNSRLTRASNIDFTVVINDDDCGEITWKGDFNRTSLKCTHEIVSSHKNTIMFVKDEKCSISFKNKESLMEFDNKDFPVVFKYTGSVISALVSQQLNPPLLALKKHLQELKSLDLLSPSSLKQFSHKSDKDMGLGGEKLSAFLSELSNEQKHNLTKKLQSIYPDFKQYKTSTLRSGLKTLSIEETYANKTLNTEAQHINDGTLRLMAILAQTQTEHTFLLFDEIENGINPELIEQLVTWLVDAPQQILVTTHSPMILNYLEDEQAEKSVILVYKTPEGYTQTKRFFDIPAMKEKLLVLGVGEVFIDTDLKALVTEINNPQHV